MARAVRKSSMCDCGCGGCCALFHLYRYSCRWRQAKKPTSTHDGSPRITSDDQRKALSGTDMASKTFVMDIQGVSAEFALRWGFTRWSSKHHPRFAYSVTLQDIADNKTDGWVGRTLDDYTNCCASCEVWTLFRILLHRDILFLLTFNGKVKEAMYATWIPVQTTAWNCRPRWPMSCSSRFSSNFQSSCCFGGVRRRHALITVEIGTSIDDRRRVPPTPLGDLFDTGRKNEYSRRDQLLPTYVFSSHVPAPKSLHGTFGDSGGHCLSIALCEHFLHRSRFADKRSSSEKALIIHGGCLCVRWMLRPDVACGESHMHDLVPHPTGIEKKLDQERTDIKNFFKWMKLSTWQ